MGDGRPEPHRCGFVERLGIGTRRARPTLRAPAAYLATRLLFPLRMFQSWEQDLLLDPLELYDLHS